MSELKGLKKEHVGKRILVRKRSLYSSSDSFQEAIVHECDEGCIFFRLEYFRPDRTTYHEWVSSKTEYYGSPMYIVEKVLEDIEKKECSTSEKSVKNKGEEYNKLIQKMIDDFKEEDSYPDIIKRFPEAHFCIGCGRCKGVPKQMGSKSYYILKGD